MVIGGYSIVRYWCLLMAISGYFVIGYWCLLMVIILIGYWWLFY